MSRRIRRAMYVAAFLLPPLAAGALGLRELQQRTRPASLPPLDAARAALVASPAHDSTKPTVAVLLGADVTEIIDALGPYEMFARAGKFNVYAVAPQRRPTLLSGGLRILPHLSLAELDARLAGRPPAIVIVPNIPNIAEAQNRPLVSWMQRQAGAGAIMHSWCTGAMALAEAGLLDGRTATAHWGDLGRLAERYPRVQWVRGVRWVDHGSLVTSAGLTSGVDASLRVLRRVAGDSVARRVAAEIRYPNYHFALDPVAPQYDIRPGDAVLLANAAFRVARPQVGVALFDGIGELDLGAFYDAHVYSAVADAHAVAMGSGVVQTAHGLALLPSIAPTSSVGGDAASDVRRLDRLVVPGADSRSSGARVVHAVRALAPALPIAHLQEDTPRRFVLEPVLEDLARMADLPTARFAMRRLEYRSASVRLEGSALPWGAVVPALALGLAGVLIVRALTRHRTARRLGTAAATLVLIAPATARAQTLEGLGDSTRIRVEMLTAERPRFTWLARGGPQSVAGTLAGLRGDTVLLRVTPGVEPLRVPRAAIHAVHVSRGRPSRWQSALRSAVVPALAGAAFRGIGASVRRGDGDPSPGQAALSGAAMGAAVAAVKGALFPKERWHRLETSRRAQAGVDAAGRSETKAGSGTVRRTP